MGLQDVVLSPSIFPNPDPGNKYRIHLYDNELQAPTHHHRVLQNRIGQKEVV